MTTKTGCFETLTASVIAALLTLFGAYIGRVWGASHWAPFFYGIEERAEGEFRATLVGAVCAATVWQVVKSVVLRLRSKRG